MGRAHKIAASPRTSLANLHLTIANLRIFFEDLTSVGVNNHPDNPFDFEQGVQYLREQGFSVKRFEILAETRLL